MILGNGKFIEAVFANNNKNSILAIWHDDETDSNYEIIIEVNLNDHMYVKLLERFTIDEINTMTDQKRKSERMSFESIVKKIAMNEGLIFDPTTKNNTFNLDSIFTPTDDDQATDNLFNIKLRIFDMSVVTNSSDTVLKKKLREAKTPIEAFYVAGKFLFE